MPTERGGSMWTRGGMLGIPGRRFGIGQPFRSRPFSTYQARITGVTKNSAGVALGSCVVQLFRTADDVLILEDQSDASGNYTLYPTVGGPFYIVAYKAGAPDVAGTTINTVTVL